MECRKICVGLKMDREIILEDYSEFRAEMNSAENW